MNCRQAINLPITEEDKVNITNAHSNQQYLLYSAHMRETWVEGEREGIGRGGIR